MNVDALLEDLAARGVTLSAFGGDVDFDAPAGVMTAALRAELTAEKDEVLAVLRRPGRWAGWVAALLRLALADPQHRGELAEDFDERAGVLEYDAGLPRDLAEAGAFHDMLLRAGGRDVAASRPVHAEAPAGRRAAPNNTQ